MSEEQKMAQAQMLTDEQREAISEVMGMAYEMGLPGTGDTLKSILAAPTAPAPFQQRVQPWMLECFGTEIASDRIERNHRFFEEATELVQANGMTSSEAHQLVDYTFDRPVGDLHQEVGGVMVTLAALCLASGADMHAAGETELARIWTKVEQIRAKQAAKPKHSPLPAAPAPAAQAGKQTNIETLRKGFKTSRVCGPDNLYEISIKFRSIEDLHTADDELRALMLAAIVARQHQSGEAQASGQAPAAGAEPEKRGWPAIDKAIKDYLEDYELRADEGSHTPTEGELFLIYDAISGLLSEDEFLALLAAPVAARAPAVPLGLAVVPSEPTQEMRLGAWLAWKTFEGECEDERMQAALREAIASSPTVASAVPDGMIERIKAAEQRIYDNQATRRIPADPTDVDLVLAEVRMFLEGKPRPFWIKTASTAPASAAPAPLPDERAAFAAAMLAAGARDYGGNTWEWDDADFLFKFWKQARSTAASEDKHDA